MKLLAFQFITILAMAALAVDSIDKPPMYWSDLGIIAQIRIVAGLSFMVAIGIAASVIFRSIWVKEGYAGVDKILEDREVALFMSHVLAFILVEVFFYMIVFISYTQPPQYVFYICAAGFLSPEVVQGLHFIMDRFKTVKK